MQRTPLPLCIAAALVGPLFGSPTVGADSFTASDTARLGHAGDTRPVDAVRAVLARRSEDPAPTRAALVKALVDLGPDHAAPTVELLIHAGHQEGLPVPGEATPASIGEDDRDVLRTALETWPANTVFAAAHGVARTRTVPSDRLEVARVVSELRVRGTLRPVLRILTTVEDPQFRSAHMSRIAGACIRRALDADGQAWLDLRREVDALGPGALTCVADCLDPADVHELECLVDLLGRDAWLDTRVLSNLLRLDVRTGLLARDLAGSRVVELAAGPDRPTRKLALLVLGAWQESDAVEVMIARLADPHRSVQRAATTALCSTAGVTWPGDPARWQAWHSEQRTWLDERAPELRDVLLADDASLAARACRELGDHPVWRRELLPIASAGLGHDDPMVVRAACDAIERLGAFEGIALVIPLLEDADEELQAHAEAVLERMTGTSLGGDPDDWWTWLQG